MSTDTRERIEVTEAELTGILLASISSAKPIGIVSITPATCFYKGKDGSRKKDAEPCPPVVKYQHIGAITCFSYANARRNDDIRERARQIESLRSEGREAEADEMEATPLPERTIEARQWGERIQGTPFVRHTSKTTGETYLYVELMISTGNNPSWPKGSNNVEYRHPTDPMIQYTLNDQEDGKISLRPWLKPKRVRTDNEPKDFGYRDLRMDHIVEVRTGGKVYVVRRPTVLIEAA